MYSIKDPFVCTHNHDAGFCHHYPLPENILQTQSDMSSRMQYEESIRGARGLCTDLGAGAEAQSLKEEARVLRAENAYLKELTHSRLAEVEHWKKMYTNETLNNKGRTEAIRKEFEAKYDTEVKKIGHLIGNFATKETNSTSVFQNFTSVNNLSKVDSIKHENQVQIELLKKQWEGKFAAALSQELAELNRKHKDEIRLKDLQIENLARVTSDIKVKNHVSFSEEIAHSANKGNHFQVVDLIHFEADELNGREKALQEKWVKKFQKSLEEELIPKLDQLKAENESLQKKLTAVQIEKSTGKKDEIDNILFAFNEANNGSEGSFKPEDLLKNLTVRNFIEEKTKAQNGRLELKQNR